jgi:hypothetical protein
MDRMNEQPQEQRKRTVMIGTPCYDGKIDVWHANSLVQTIKMSAELGVEIYPIWLSYDALIQRARNDIVALMMDMGCDDLIFIDADIDWNPNDFYKLLSYPVDVVGGTYPKKGDIEEYVAKILDPMRAKDPHTGLLETEGLGTGFLRMSRKAVQHLWDNCPKYSERGRDIDRRWIFNVEIKGGDLVSEDIHVCDLLRAGGFPVWLDTQVTCGHNGIKHFTGNFDAWFTALRSGQIGQPQGQPQQPISAPVPTPNFGYGTPQDIKSLYE